MSPDNRAETMVRLTTLGEFVIEINGRTIKSLPPAECALLLFLALQPGKRVGRRTILNTIWPDLRDDDGRQRLRKCVYVLRKLRCGLLREHFWLEFPAAEVHLDVQAELTRYAAGSLDADGPFGPFLAGYSPSISTEFSTWLDGHRARVHATLRQSLFPPLTENRRRGRWPSVDLLARRCLSFDPLNEEATLALAESAAMTGSKVEALQILDRYLADLGIRGKAEELRLPAELLRRRISERLPQEIGRAHV